MKLSKEIQLPSIAMTGFETPMSEEEQAIQLSVHRFAKDVLRPLGRELDKMTAAQVVAPGSPYYGMFAEAAKLGLDPDLLGQLPPEMAIRVESMIGEEMGWGDSGLAVSLTVTQFPLEMAKTIGNQELIDLSTGKIGCWMITHPDKGTDVGAFDMKREWVPGAQGNKGTMRATVGKDEITINGQCSAWVSNGAVAQVALAYLTADYGDGYYDADGRPNGVAVIVPLDLPDVTSSSRMHFRRSRSGPIASPSTHFRTCAHSASVKERRISILEAGRSKPFIKERIGWATR